MNSHILNYPRRFPPVVAVLLGAALPLSLVQAQSLEEILKVRPLPVQSLKEQYGKEVLPELKRFCQDPDMLRYGENVVLATALLGGEEGTDFLISYLLHHFEGHVGDNERRALFSVPLALGNQAASGNAKALDFLKAHSTVKSWRGAGLKWWHRKYQGEALYGALAHDALLGLAGVRDGNTDDVFSRLMSDSAGDWAETRRALRDFPEILKFRELHRRETVRSATQADSGSAGGTQAAVAQGLQGDPIATGQRSPSSPGSKILPILETEARVLSQEALNSFERISRIFDAEPLAVSSAHLADNNRPLLHGRKASAAETDAFLKSLVEAGAIEKSRTILRELRTLGIQYGSPTVSKQLDGSILVIVPIERTAETKRRHVPRNNPTSTVTQHGDLAVVMVKVGEEWFWQPFGW